MLTLGVTSRDLHQALERERDVYRLFLPVECTLRGYA